MTRVVVNRAAELAFLDGRLRRRQAVAVIGAMGVGKTTVLRAAASQSGSVVLEGGGFATLKWMPYLPLAHALGTRPPNAPPQGVAEWVVERVGKAALVLDDLQWADQDTLTILPILAGRVRVAAGLDTGADSEDALRRLESGGFAVLELEPLSDDDVWELLDHFDLRLDDESRAEIVAQARGNPMLARYLAAGKEDDPSFEPCVRSRIRRLSTDARIALAALALAEEPLAGAFLGTGVDELRRANLVLERGASYVAWHPLAARLGLDLLEPAERAAVHARLAETARSPGAAAVHYTAAGRRLDAYLKAVEAVASVESPGRRAQFLGIAAENATGSESDRMRLQAAGALLATGQYENAHRLASEIRTGNPVLEAEAALAQGRASLWLREVGRAEAELEHGAVAVAGTTLPIAVRLQMERARLVLYERDPEKAGRFVEGARALANATGVEHAFASHLNGLAKRLRFQADSVRDFKAAIEMARDATDDWLEAEAHTQLVSSLMLFGKPEQALPSAERLVSRAKSLDQRGWVAVANVQVATARMHHLGRYEEAAAMIAPLLDDGTLGPYLEEAQALHALALAYSGHGSEGSSRVKRSLASAPLPWGLPVLLLARAEIEWLAGRSSIALTAVEQLRLATGRGFEDLLALGSIFEGWALVDQGRTPPPEAAPPVASLAAVPIELRAIRRFASPDGAADASVLFEEAASAWARLRHSSEMRCRWAAGEAARLAGDSRRAEALLAPMEAELFACGATSMLSRVHTSLRRAGVAVAAAAAVVPHRGRPSRLTTREREILRFVGSGLSSRDIARMLLIAPSTVETQIRTAMRKLGATTRAQAATLVYFRTEDALLGSSESTDPDAAG